MEKQTTIRIRMMDHFAIYIDDKPDKSVEKSRKGVMLMQVLIASAGEPVPNYKLMSYLWSEEKITNPESALKTLVSRLRSQLNQLVPEFGKCIAVNYGDYSWKCMPGMTIDLYEINELFEQIDMEKANGTVNETLCDRLMTLYSGDLLINSGRNDWALAPAATLHKKYMGAVYDYIDLLKEQGKDEQIISVCRKALEIDGFDDRLHMEMMSALIKLKRNGEALTQYKQVMHLYNHYLGVRPSDDIQKFYKQIENSGKTLDMNVESICDELLESDNKYAFVCEYTVFKEIFNLQMRNLERLGSTMFLAAVMINNVDGSPMDPIMQDNIVEDLIDLMRKNLRKGDTISRFSPSIVVLLLPMVNYSTGSNVMERIKFLFYRKHPNSDVLFNYRIEPLNRREEEGRPI